ncbi:MAG: YHS domain protein [Pedobacter sp.]|nr:MAG: YHS domain protein [Pedobacter sp.]
MRIIITMLLLVFSLTPASAQTAQRKKNFNLDKSALAIEGFDPVAYFTLKKAVQGKKEISLINDGVIYHFATTQNRELFKANPLKYEPQFGGWCAYAMGKTGEKVTVDEKTIHSYCNAANDRITG